jgi:hypothetical protein
MTENNPSLTSNVREIMPSLLKCEFPPYLLDKFLAAVPAIFAPCVRTRTSKEPSDLRLGRRRGGRS